MITWNTHFRLRTLPMGPAGCQHGIMASWPHADNCYCLTEKGGVGKTSLAQVYPVTVGCRKPGACDGWSETGHSPRAVACSSASPDDSTLNLPARPMSPALPARQRTILSNVRFLLEGSSPHARRLTLRILRHHDPVISNRILRRAQRAGAASDTSTPKCCSRRPRAAAKLPVVRGAVGADKLEHHGRRTRAHGWRTGNQARSTPRRGQAGPVDQAFRAGTVWGIGIHPYLVGLYEA